jgi:hypothetical protein
MVGLGSSRAFWVYEHTILLRMGSDLEQKSLRINLYV